MRSVVFVTHEEHRYTHELFARVMRDDHDLPVHVADYAAPGRVPVADALVVLCDLERFAAADRPRLVEAEDELRRRGAGRVLNSPSRVKTRLELLRHLAEVGLNEHRAAALDGGQHLRYPVFLRGDRDHDGPRTALLHSAAEVRAAVAAAGPGGPDLVVEFADCRRRPADLFHKYGAVGWCGQVIPRHLFFSPDWSVKRPRRTTDEQIAREAAYIAANEHAARVAEVFAEAGIDYGRIDFAARPTGGIITFEINTNPAILDEGDLVNERRRYVTRTFLTSMSAAFTAALG
ncbi:hypothetical protein [Actinoplanes sp. NPDC049599]|uniref:hypothetical protein n=1 Tax=Actinoplanes sp. NPDC049599 TaxID=3363903 RepID=UPI0037BCBB2A